MDAFIVGDLHGDITFYRLVKQKFPNENIILLGDLVDSFVCTRAEQINLVEEVIKDLEDKKVQCVKGNHELSYLFPERMKASGYASSFAARLIPYFSKMHSLMSNYILDEDKAVLISHAGLTYRLLSFYKTFILQSVPGESVEIDLKTFLEESCRDLDNGLVYNIGRSRGGVDSVGGIFWCDYFVDFEPIEGLTQIFGHTPVSEIKQKGNNWNIDCLPEKSQIIHLKNDNSVEKVDIDI
ncbi:MAG: metallophosphoesterase [Methanogenium sp.]|jgi:hypothetical protein